MAKVKLNPILEGMRGKIGDLIFRRYGDEVIIGRAPDTTSRVPTATQEAQRQRFKLAALYGSTVLADPEQKAIYAATARQKGLPVFAVTVSDFLHAPVVEEIDLSSYNGKAGEPIRIRASDDFEVKGVEVSITDSNGTVLERGSASNGAPAWEYVARTSLPAGQSVTIEVTASDRPGHKTTKTQVRP